MSSRKLQEEVTGSVVLAAFRNPHPSTKLERLERYLKYHLKHGRKLKRQRIELEIQAAREKALAVANGTDAWTVANDSDSDDSEASPDLPLPPSYFQQPPPAPGPDGPPSVARIYEEPNPKRKRKR
jgi:hypothetical protein